MFSNLSKYNVSIEAFIPISFKKLWDAKFIPSQRERFKKNSNYINLWFLNEIFWVQFDSVVVFFKIMKEDLDSPYVVKLYLGFRRSVVQRYSGDAPLVRILFRTNNIVFKFRLDSPRRLNGDALGWPTKRSEFELKLSQKPTLHPFWGSGWAGAFSDPSNWTSYLLGHINTDPCLDST